jgi:acyl dehydratase
MTTHLETPADHIDLVGQQRGTTDWMKITQEQVNLYASATRDHRRIHTDPQRAAHGRFNGTIAHRCLTPARAPAVISDVSQIGAVTSALNDGRNKARFPSSLPVNAPIGATVAVMSAQHRTSGVESVFEWIYEIDGEKRPACVASVIVLHR